MGGYTKEWEDEELIKQKAQRCLEIWEMVQMGMEREFRFLRDRDGLYRILVRICEKDMDLLVLSHPSVIKVRKIETEQDKAIKAKVKELCKEADILSETPSKEDLIRVKNLLEQAEKLNEYLKRPYSLCDVIVGSNGITKGQTAFIKREIEIE